MVLELKVPHRTEVEALRPLFPVFVAYVLSFIFVGIYWNNHHHMLHAAERITGKVLWPNLHLLFWLSLVPFVTGWMGENHFAAVPTAVYGDERQPEEQVQVDRKSTRLNSSHSQISYAVFCLKKK